MPAEFLIFSDFHAHNFRYGSKRVRHPDLAVDGLFNSRLIDCVGVLRDISRYAEEHGIKYVFFGGDLFHKRLILNTDVLSVIHREIVNLSSVCHVYMIPGNHDYGDRAGHVHSLSVFKGLPNITVLDGVEFVAVGDKLRPDIGLITVPYTDDPELAKTWLQTAGEYGRSKFRDDCPVVLLAHLGMQGAKVGSDYVLISDSDVEVEDVPYDAFDVCFFGHYHQHQKLFKNGWFVGASHQHNWGDAGTKRGFLHVKLDSGRVDFDLIETRAPRFINLQESELTSPDVVNSIRSQDFVRVHVTSRSNALDFEDLTELTERYSELLKAGRVEPIVHTEPTASTEELELPADRLEAAALMEKWVEHHVDDTSAARYLKLGLELLKRAQEQAL